MMKMFQKSQRAFARVWLNGVGWADRASNCWFARAPQCFKGPPTVFKRFQTLSRLFSGLQFFHELTEVCAGRRNASAISQMRLRTTKVFQWPSMFSTASACFRMSHLCSGALKGFRRFVFEVAHISRSLELPEIIWHALQASSCCGSIEKAVNAC